MNIESPRFGTLTVEPSKIIEFPQGLVGMETSRRFTLFHPEGTEPKFFILQSIDDPEIALKVVDPALLGFSYEIELSDEETALLKYSDPADIVVVVIVWSEAASLNQPGSQLRANLKAPLVINTRERRGLQHIFLELNCAVPVDVDMADGK